MVIDAFVAMKSKKVREVYELLEEAKKKLEKDFKNGENNIKERIMNTKINIFVESLIKCYNPEKYIFLPTELLPDLKKDRIVKKIKKQLIRLNDLAGRKKSDSQWKKGLELGLGSR